MSLIELLFELLLLLFELFTFVWLDVFEFKLLWCDTEELTSWFVSLSNLFVIEIGDDVGVEDDEEDEDDDDWLELILKLPLLLLLFVFVEFVEEI